MNCLKSLTSESQQSLTSLKNEAKICEFATTFESTSNAVSKSESHVARKGRGT